MRSGGRSRSIPWRPSAAALLAIVFVVAFAVLPLALVTAQRGALGDGFTCKIRVESRLAHTMGGKLEFLLVAGVEGVPPADTFVVTVDHGYTKGATDVAGPAGDPEVAPGRTFWIEGSLMNRETYFGEQYLFFGRPQLYLSQIKCGALWPVQVERLATLYLAPVTSLGSVYLVWALPFMEEYTAVSWLLVIARFVLVCAAIFLAFRLRKRGPRRGYRLIPVIGLYALAAVALAIPGL